MRPAASVLLLTTLTGFGYGLLAWLGVYAALGLLPSAPSFGVGAIALALLLASVGLVSSTLHLGRKERAWRAFSQWRSSWLSREGIAAVLTYPIAIVFAVAVYRGAASGAAVRVLGVLAAAAALITVFCTSMIYASLRPIRQWHNAHTAPDYLIYALFSGALLLALLKVAAFGTPGAAAGASFAAAAIALIAKQAYWRHIDAQTPLATLASAIGLPRGAEVKPLDAPHFTENYVLREMGFTIARRHAAKLRRIALMLGFAAPLGLSLLASFAFLPLFSLAAALACAALGLLTERWLFFAEATHVSALYYGRRT
jgi:DMSO reductase anchor subunit